jgi:protein SCO1/2
MRNAHHLTSTSTRRAHAPFAARAALALPLLICVGGAQSASAQQQKTTPPAQVAPAAASATHHCQEMRAAEEPTTKGATDPTKAVTSAINSTNGDAAAKPSIPDVEIVDQNGKAQRFYTDIVKGKAVIINFIFTSCTYVCPMQGANFARLQTALGERLGRDIFLVSVSTDPTVDTPERLKAWGARFGAKPGWTLVTGRKEEIDKLLVVLTGDEARRGEHSPFALVGDFGRGAWLRTYGLAEPERYIQLLATLNASNAEQQSTARK